MTQASVGLWEVTDILYRKLDPIRKSRMSVELQYLPLPLAWKNVCYVQGEPEN